MEKVVEKTNQSQRILETTYKCLSEKGYANVSMRDIADAAGVALSQLNYYYKNKEGLFNEVVKFMVQRYLDEINEKLKHSDDAKERANSLVTYFNDLIKGDQRLLKLFIDFTAQSLWLPSIRRQLKSLLNELSEMIEKNMHKSSMFSKYSHKHSSKTIAKMFLGALYGTSIHIMLDSEDDEAFDSLNMLGMLFE